MVKKRKKARIVFTIVVLIIFYYLNATYVLNFFNSEWPVFIKRFYSREIHILNQPSSDSLLILPGIRLISVLVYSILITSLHFMLMVDLANKKKAFLFLILSISILFVSAISFFSSNFFSSNSNLYFLSRVLKDFALSPLIVGVFLLFNKISSSDKEP